MLLRSTIWKQPSRVVGPEGPWAKLLTTYEVGGYVQGRFKNSATAQHKIRYNVLRAHKCLSLYKGIIVLKVEPAPPPTHILRTGAAN